MRTGKQKVAEICELLKEKTLEPAQEEARRIIDEANEKALSILAEANKAADKRLADGEKELEQKRRTFETSIQLAVKQTLEMIKQRVETRFFSEEFARLVKEGSSNKTLIAELVTSLVGAIDKAGIESELLAYVSDKFDPKEVIALLSAQVRDKVKLVGSEEILSGVRLKIVKENFSIDLSDVAIRDLILSFVHQDFRQIAFAQ